nr:MAG TPA: hypothetical protein [Caudoviricetes sp.]
MKIEVRSVVCDYGVYEDEKLLFILNDKENAELIKEVLEADAEHKRYKNKKIDKMQQVLDFIEIAKEKCTLTTYHQCPECKYRKKICDKMIALPIELYSDLKFLMEADLYE